MIRFLPALFLFCVVATFKPSSASTVLSDPDATPETIVLYENLREAAKDHLLYGQYRAYTFGKHTQPEEHREKEPRFDQTDAGALVGAHPAVVEFGLHKPEYYDYWKKLAPELHRRGVIISLSSHSRNPDLEIPYNDSHKDNRGDPVTKVLDRSSADHQAYMEVLRSYGEFIRDLRDDEGKPIPVLLRLYHEHTGGWFWWGSRTCTPEQFNELWKMTIDFFRDEMDLHNLILVISPDKPFTKEKYLSRLPDLEYVDIMGMDAYMGDPEQFLLCARNTVELAREHNKIPAITEFGFRRGFSQQTDPQFYTKMFLENIQEDPVANEMAFALTWFGRKPEGSEEPVNWTAYDDEPTTMHIYPDFVKFRNDPWTVFEGDLPNLYQ
ncbi:MAG: glycosyl hydrolase [Verrucomicrobiota bacterium]